MPEAKAIQAYLVSLTDGRTTNRVISGQFGAYGDGENAQTSQQALQEIFDQSGKWVGLTGMDYHTWDLYHEHNYNEPNQFLINQWRLGSLVTISWHSPNPWTGREADDWDAGNWQPYNVRELITPGTTVNQRWMALLDDVAGGLQQLKQAGVVVIWRPFHEMNGGWFWWHQQTQANFTALWRHMFDYFTTTKGLNNLLWAYSPNWVYDQWTEPATYFYPGANYVDIVSLDKYMSRGEDPLALNQYKDYDDLVATGKPVGLLEFGPSPPDGSGWQDPKYDYSKLIRDIKARYPKIVLFQAWEWIWRIGAHANASGLLNDPWVITRDELPKWSGGTGTPMPTAVPPTSTPIPPTATRTSTRTPTNVPTNAPTNVPTNTRTNTAIPPTPTNTRTNTAVPPTNTRTNTPLPTAVSTTAVPPTATNTATSAPTNAPTNTTAPTNAPTNTGTNTAVPPTASRTNTPLPTAVSTTAVPPTATRTRTQTPTVRPTRTRRPTNTPIPPTARRQARGLCTAPSTLVVRNWSSMVRHGRRGLHQTSLSTASFTIPKVAH
jgi:mannan endo-1,4-beta-mannosidase